jgi:MoaA/NifB/PqqE/SkfB family radical SAM enzyme
VGGPIPVVLAISPTMRCNYNCGGCYSRGRPTDGELSTEELDTLLGEAERLGVAAVIVTGGEPLLRDDMVDLMVRRPRLLFVTISNGSLVTPEMARRLAKSENVILLVSIDGPLSDTDRQRQPGAYTAAIGAFGHLRRAGACFGFAATNTAANLDHLGEEAFVDRMVSCGCAIGFFSEYVPCGPNPQSDWVLDEGSRDAFRKRVLDFQRRKPILLGQFPHDEYDPENRCSGAGRISLHINSQGYVEPCPFMAVARENIRSGGLIAACESAFLRSIRRQPTLLRRQRFACSLFEHRAELAALAERAGAHSTKR